MTEVTNPKFAEWKEKQDKLMRQVNPKFIILCQDPEGLLPSYPFIGDLGGEEGFDLDTAIRVASKKEARKFDSFRDAQHEVERLKKMVDGPFSKMSFLVIAEYFLVDD